MQPMPELCVENLLLTLQPVLQPLLDLPESAQQWGIGGSVLLVRLGLLRQARDLDLVCTEQVFPTLAGVLSRHYELLAVMPHPLYCSRCFQRFRHPSGLVIELMAGIAVRQSDSASQPLRDWAFHPEMLEWQGGLPWMTASQWLALYQLFDRPARVCLLTDYLLTD